MTVKISFAYKQGFRRLWLVLSVIYLAFVVGFNWREQEAISVFFLIGILPVAVLYLLGVICVWVIEGFARADR